MYIIPFSWLHSVAATGPAPRNGTYLHLGRDMLDLRTCRGVRSLGSSAHSKVEYFLTQPFSRDFAVLLFDLDADGAALYGFRCSQCSAASHEWIADAMVWI